jgi:hypothetical protein
VRGGHLTEDEQRLLGDKRNQRALAQAWSRVHNGPVELELVTGGAASRAQSEVPERARPARDPFTQRVVQDFEGTVEELS